MTFTTAPGSLRLRLSLPGVAAGDLERLALLASRHRVRAAKLQRLADSIVAGTPWPIACEREGIPRAIGENLAFVLNQTLSGGLGS